MHTPNFPEISLNFRSKSSIRPTRNFVCITFAQLFTSFARSFLVRRAIISSSTNSLRIEIARRVNQTLASKDFWLLLKTHKAKFGICLQEATEDSLKAEKRKLQREVCLIHSHFYRVFICIYIYLFIYLFIYRHSRDAGVCLDSVINLFCLANGTKNTSAERAKHHSRETQINQTNTEQQTATLLLFLTVFISF